MKSENPQGIRLGDVVKDSISGFQGVVTSWTDWLNGCTRLGVTPEETKDGKPVETHSFDIEQLVLVKARNRPAAVKHGGDRDDAVQRSDATR